jgi:hypothetical protein
MEKISTDSNDKPRKEIKIIKSGAMKPKEPANAQEEEQAI